MDQQLPKGLRYTPAAKALADYHKIALADVTPKAGYKITKDDVEAFIANKSKPKADK